MGISEGDPLLEEYKQLCHPPNASTKQIDIDVSRTFPAMFSSPESQQAILRVLNAYAAYNPCIGYCQGMNFVVALLLLVSEFREEESFVFFCRLMDSPEYGLAGFYREGLPLLWRCLRACDHLMESLVPEVRDHFVRESVQPAMYLHQWFLTLFISCFPLPIVLIIWDVIIFEGLPVVIRVAVSVLRLFKESLLAMHLEDIVKFFKKMKTYEGEDGGLKTARGGQMLMKRTEDVSIPEEVLRYLADTEDFGWSTDLLSLVAIHKTQPSWDAGCCLAFRFWRAGVRSAACCDMPRRGRSRWKYGNSALVRPAWSDSDDVRHAVV